MRRTRREWARYRNEQEIVAEVQELVEAGVLVWVPPTMAFETLSAVEALGLGPQALTAAEALGLDVSRRSVLDEIEFTPRVLPNMPPGQLAVEV